MARPIQPSREALQKAWALGRKMAMSDPLLRPMMGDAVTFRQYEEFRLVHRSQMEAREAFTRWEEQVTLLAEREAKRMGMRLESNVALDFFIAKIVVPMKHAFWVGWEAARGLDRLFAEVRRRTSEQEVASAQVKVFRATQLADRVQVPEMAESGDDGFLVSVTGEGEALRDKSRPQVLAARALVNVDRPQAKKEPAGDDLSGLALEVDEITADAVMPGEAREKPAAVILDDDDVPDPYDTSK